MFYCIPKATPSFPRVAISPAIGPVLSGPEDSHLLYSPDLDSKQIRPVAQVNRSRAAVADG
jgi:hypothetical protein